MFSLKGETEGKIKGKTEGENAMELKRVAMSAIKPYPGNPRINDGAVEAVAESIRQCGYCAPIVVDENMVILAGHTRHKALTRLGWVSVMVCVVPCLTSEQKRKYRLLDNKTNEIAGWDFALREQELEGLDFDGFDFGFSTQFMDGNAIPQNLDGEDYDANQPIACKITFDNYTAYSMYEDELKEIAERMNATFSVVKA